MTTERTLAIIKPDAVEKRHIGGVIGMIEEAGLEILALRLMHLTRIQAQEFYAVHRERPFYDELVTFMTRGPVVVMALAGKDAVTRYRKLMGATNPADAAEGTIRKRFAASIGENACHGSDSAENAKVEVGFFFPGYEIG